MKRKHLYITVLAISLVGYFIFEWTKPQPINWSESYSSIDKIPYGCYIMRDMLPDLFPQQQIDYQSQPIFSARDSSYYKNAIFINSQFAPDKYEAEELLNQVKNGKNIFIAAKTMGGPLADTLNVGTSHAPIFNPSTITGQPDSTTFSLNDATLQKKTAWNYPEQLNEYHFTSYDTLNSSILGSNSDGEANFVKVHRGEGAFFLHTVPYVFTNFYMRDYPHAEYAFSTLSYLPVAPTVWDEYYKAGRAASSSPLRYIVSHPYLRWSWITALAGLFLFILFRSKRRERIIPKIERPQNTTVEFTKTIGRLYHQNGNHKNLADKKITYFLDYIRKELNLDTRQINDHFIQQVAQRAGVDTKTVETVFTCIANVQEQSTLGSRELWKLNTTIEIFYQQSSR